jgi:hypothetical protein
MGQIFNPVALNVWNVSLSRILILSIEEKSVPYKAKS